MNQKLNSLQYKTLNVDSGLLILRIWFSVVLFAKHGAEKIFGFHAMQVDFPDPVGIGSTPGLVLALVADGVCSLLIAFGLYTRLAAFLIGINLLVVFTLLHGFSFAQEHAEVVYLYLGGILTLLFTGAGKYSIDSLLTKRRSFLSQD